MGRGIRAALVAASIAAPTVALADEIHVPEDYARLAEALEAARPGDTVVLDAGTHRGPFAVERDGIAIEGRGGRLVQGREVLRDSSRAGEPVLSVRGDGVTLRSLEVSRGGLRVEGDGATVQQCRLQRSGARRGVVRGVEVRGDGATVRTNLLEGGRGNFQGVHVEGSGAEVWGNVVDGVRGARGIEVRGAAAYLHENEVSVTTGREGILVEGDDGTATGNRIDIASGEGGGIALRGDGGTIWENTVAADSLGGPVLLLEGSDGVVSGGWFGAVDRTAIVVRGNRCRIQDVRVSGRFPDSAGVIVGHGIVVRGSGNVVAGCDVWGAPADGIRIVAGDGNRIEGSGVRRSGACGLLNVGTGTAVSRTGFSSNGTDVLNAGTVTTFTDSRFDTGTLDSVPFTGGTGEEEDFGVEFTGTPGTANRPWTGNWTPGWE